MITNQWFRIRRLASALAGAVSILSVLGNPSAAFAASWSQAVTIAPSLPTTAPNAFAFNPAGGEVWATAPGVSGGAVVQVAQRSFGGGWSPLATIATIHSVGFVTVQDLSIALSASSHPVAVWSVGGGVQIALRSPAGAWQAPASFAPTGGASHLRARLDAQGNGVAVWSRLTSAASVVEAVTWTAAGNFGNVVQLSSPAQGAFLPDLAVNEAGTAVVVWQAAAPLDDSNPDQVEAATLPAGGSWTAVTAASPVMPQTWSPHVALDSFGNATVVWEQGPVAGNYRVYAATRLVGGEWGNPVPIEPSNQYLASQSSVAADAAGNVTASWVAADVSGARLVRAASRPTGGVWSTPTSLGQLTSSGSSTPLPPVTAARDGSISVVSWGNAGGAGTLPNVAVRLGSGAWVSMVISGSPPIADVLATNNARASVVWPVPNGVKYHHALKQSDYR